MHMLGFGGGWGWGWGWGIILSGFPAASAAGLVRAPLTCSAITVRHAWEKNGAAIDVNASPRLRLDPDGTLHVSQTWSGDIGTYTCRVTSVGGNDSRNAHLRVRSARLPFLSRISSVVLHLRWRCAPSLMAFSFSPPPLQAASSRSRESSRPFERRREASHQPHMGPGLRRQQPPDPLHPGGLGKQ